MDDPRKHEDSKENMLMHDYREQLKGYTTEEIQEKLAYAFSDQGFLNVNPASYVPGACLEGPSITVKFSKESLGLFEVFVSDLQFIDDVVESMDQIGSKLEIPRVKEADLEVYANYQNIIEGPGQHCAANYPTKELCLKGTKQLF